MLPEVITHTLAFAAGAFAWWWASRLPIMPFKPRCRAVLVSGEQCIYASGHKGYHRAEWQMYSDDCDSPACAHCWEDPTCGVHSGTTVEWEDRT